jgi:tetratricopeptide (TPR) repeat protein
MNAMNQAEKARKWFEETFRLHRSPNPDLKKVVAGYKKSLEFNPGDPQVIYHLGVAQLALRETSNAREQFEKALRIKPDMPEALFHLGQALLQQQRAGEAEQAYRKAVDLTPREQRAPLRFALAMALQAQVEPLQRSGERELATRKLKAAEECYRTGMEENPDDVNGQFQFAVFLQNVSHLPEYAGALEEAARLLDGVLVKVPEHRDVLNLRALVYSRMNQPAEAVALLEKAIELSPGDAGLLFNLAQLVERAGDGSRARSLLEKSLELQPRQPGALSQLAGLIAHQDADFDKALGLIEQGLALAPGDALLLYQKALVLTTRAESLEEAERAPLFAEARRWVERALESRGDFLPAQQLLARLGGGPVPGVAPQVAEDPAEIKTQLEADPDNDELKRRLAQAHLARRDFAQALPLLEDLAARHPEDARLQLNRALVLSYEAGRDTARIKVARDSLRTAIGALPEVEAPARLRLAQLDILLREPEEAVDLLVGLRAAAVAGEAGLDEAQVWQLTGVAWQQKGFLEEAEQAFAAAIERLDARGAAPAAGSVQEAALREAVGSRAQVLELLGREEEALAALERWAGLAPRDVAPLGRLATLHNRAGRFAEGYEVLKRMEAIDDQNPGTLFYMGLTLMDLERHQEAESCLMKALELRPDFPEAQQRLHYLQQNRPLVAASLEELEQSVAADPEDLDDRLLLSQAYLNRKLWDKAAEQLSVIVERDKQNHKALYDLSNARLALGDKDGAIDCLIQLEERLPADAGVRFRLAELLLDNDEEELAVKEYRNAVEMQPNNPVFQYRYGIALSQIDREDKAETALRRALELQPTFPNAHYELGLLEYTSERHEAALKSFVTAYQQDGRNFQALYWCGMIQQKVKGNPVEAVKFFQSALAIKPDHGDSHFQLGQVFATRGRLGDARRHLQAALDAWDEDAFHRDMAEKLLAELPDSPAAEDPS